MNILVLGGTRFFGVPMINKLIEGGHKITVATRGNYSDNWGDKVTRVKADRLSDESMKELLQGNHYDVVIDKIAYCSMDIKRILQYLDCDWYIQMSTTALYGELHMNTDETDCDTSAGSERGIWQERADAPYEVVKLNAEKAIFQRLANRIYKPSPRCIAVRYPYVIGPNDYTKRLLFYVDHVRNEMPMYIDNLDNEISFIMEDEAGEFMAYLATSEAAAEFSGPINGANKGNISIRKIIEYVEGKTGKKAVLSDDGEPAPYNGTPTNTINTELAEMLGFKFQPIEKRIYKLLDELIG